VIVALNKKSLLNTKKYFFGLATFLANLKNFFSWSQQTMPFCPAKKFTQEWENIVHCTKFREYSCAHKAKIDYKNSKEPQNDDDDFDDYYDYVSDEEDDVEQEKFEWHRKQLLGAKRLTLKEPFRLYLDDEKGMALY
jgi:RNA polymerase subunit RPABC4/transcription elongation factor Spt4